MATGYTRELFQSQEASGNAVLRSEALAQLERLNRDNGGCRLPCWWGITPGVTTWEEARYTLSHLGTVYGPSIDPYDREKTELYEYEFVFPNATKTDGIISPNIIVKNSLVMAIGLNSSWIRSRFDTSLAGLLAEFGQPEEIWLDLFPESMSEPHYRIELFYPSQGILIGGDGTAKVTGNRFTICAKSFSQGNYPPGLLLFPQNEGITHESLGSFLGDPDSAKNFHRLRGLTADFNEADFYQAYNNPSNNACFNLDLTKIPERNPN